MRVFASWSGTVSREIALLFKDWLPNVLQDVEVYVSSQDISKGDRWLSNVSSNLSDHDFGLSIVTKDNLLAPWILFEAGALTKSLTSRLVPVLCGIDGIEIQNHPLSQFQYIVAPRRQELYGFVCSVNAAGRKMPEERISAIFNKWFPDFDTAYQNIDLGKAEPEARKKRDGSDADTLNALLREMRDLRSTVQELVAAPVALEKDDINSVYSQFIKNLNTSPNLNDRLQADVRRLLAKRQKNHYSLKNDDGVLSIEEDS
ncbi:hypothetical protein AB9E29_08970 [Rhizobium leguminosarum]|uniref:hypothetical protein n=1 Tax=Rhizobium leguminosarum TaxID=384 RepID=UPI003F9EA99B